MNLAATMTLNTGGFTNPLAAAKQAVGQATAQMQSAFAGATKAAGLLGVSFAAFKSVTGFTDALKGIFESGKELRTLSLITGQSVGDLVILKKAFKEAGLAPESLETNLIRLQKSLGGVNEEGQPTVGTFARLGLSVESLKGKTAADQMDVVGKAIGKLPTQSDRAAASMAIFGREGAEMLAVFSNPQAIDEARKSAGGYAAVMERNAGLFTKITNLLEGLSTKVKGFFVGFADQVGPVLLPLLQKLSSFNLVNVGEQVGGVVRTLAAAFKGGEIGEMLKLSFQIASDALANGLYGAINGFISAYWANWQNVVAQWRTLFTSLPQIWEGMKDGMIGALQAVGVVLVEIFKKPITLLQAGMEYAIQSVVGKLPAPLQKMMGMEGGLGNKSFAQIYRDRQQDGVNLFGGSTDDMALSAQTNLNKAKESLAKVAQALNPLAGFKGVFEAFQRGAAAKLVDDTGLKGALAELWKTLSESAQQVAEGTAAAHTSTTTASGPPRDSVGDRLAKIGLYVGSGGPSTDYAKKTAENTTKLVEKVQKLIEQGPRIMSPESAVWATV